MHNQSLIVDFPSERRAGITSKRRPAVHFSSEINIHFHQPLHLEADAKDELFYSSRDYRSFKRDNKQAVLELRRRYLTAGENVDAFDGCDLTGIENLLTPELIKRTSARRVGCIGAVLDEQERQDEAGESDPNLLASVSQYYSRWTTDRSRRIGMMHAMI